jgi:enterochelin esterase-like enzyme
VSLALLQLLEENETLNAEAIDRFLLARGSPIVEGPSITFLYRGDADAVLLRHFVYGLPSSQPFVHLSGTDLWYLVIEVPEGSRIEYKLEVVVGELRRLIRDPLNPRVAHDPYGSNSVCLGTGYVAPEWIQHDPEARQGTIEELVVYVPARLRPARRYPLLIVFDGRDYLHFAGMKTVLDNLIHRHEIASMVVAFTQSPDRMGEYTANPDHARWVAEDLLPFLEKRYPIRDRPRDRGLLGASLGAVASLSTAWRHPGVFGNLLLQSGSFAFTDIGRRMRDTPLEPVVEFVNEFRVAPGRPAERLFVSCGVYESLIYENRSLVPILQASGMQVRYVEARDGHNWENWRDRLREGLSWLFPGPIGLMYE